MPQAIANPEDLRRFAAELKQFNNQLRESTARLQAQFVRLGDTWRDQEHQKFALRAPPMSNPEAAGHPEKERGSESIEGMMGSPERG